MSTCNLTVLAPDDLTRAINEARRHLTTKQRAALAAEMATMKTGNAGISKGSNGPNGPLPMSNAEAAEAMGVTPAQVAEAKRLAREWRPR